MSFKNRILFFIKNHNVLVIILSIILIDQIIKIWVKTHFYLGEELKIFGSWFIIHFTENSGNLIEAGESFVEFPSTYNFAYYLVRILILILIGYFLLCCIRNKAHKSVIVAVSIIFAGAIGNILDYTFYGIIFSDSGFSIAEIFPAGGGYAPFFSGRSVQMLYFPIYEGHLPEFLGGDNFIYFRKVTNIANLSIALGALTFSFMEFVHFSSDKKYVTKSNSYSEESRTFNSLEHLIESQVSKLNSAFICPVFSKVQDDLVIYSVIVASYILPDWTVFIILLIFLYSLCKNYIYMFLRRRKKISDLFVLCEDRFYLFHFITINKKKEYYVKKIFILDKNKIVEKSASFDIIEYIPDKFDKLSSVLLFFVKKIVNKVLSTIGKKSLVLIIKEKQLSMIKLNLNKFEKLAITNTKAPIVSYIKIDHEQFNNSSLKERMVSLEFMSGSISNNSENKTMRSN